MRELRAAVLLLSSGGDRTVYISPELKQRQTRALHKLLSHRITLDLSKGRGLG